MKELAPPPGLEDVFGALDRKAPGLTPSAAGTQERAPPPGADELFGPITPPAPPARGMGDRVVDGARSVWGQVSGAVSDAAGGIGASLTQNGEAQPWLGDPGGSGIEQMMMQEGAAAEPAQRPPAQSLLERPNPQAAPQPSMGPLNEQTAARLRAALLAMTPEERAIAEQIPDWRGNAARVINRQRADQVAGSNRVADLQEHAQQDDRERDRTLIEVSADRKVAARDGLNMAGQIVATLTNGMDASSPWSQSLRAQGQAIQSEYTPQRQYQTEQMGQRIKDADGEAQKAAVTLWEMVSSPLVSIEETIKQLPLMGAMVGASALGGVAGGAAVRGAGAVSTRVALAEAIGGGALSASGRAAGTLGTGAALGAGAAGGDAASTVYQKLMDKQAIPDELLRQNPDATALMQEGKSIDEARAIIAVSKGRLAAALAAPLGALAGRTGIERLIAGTFKGSGKKAAVNELTTEVADEVSTQVAGNIAVGTVDPSQRLSEGVGQTAATTLVTTTPLAGLTAYLGRQSAAEAPIAARANSIQRFDELAAQFGLRPDAVARVKEQAGTLPSDDVPGFLSRAAAALNKRGLFQRPLDEAGIAALQSRVPDAPDAKGASDEPAAPTADFSGLADAPSVDAAPAAPTMATPAAPPATPLEDAPLDAAELLGTPLDEAAHAAATSPTNDIPQPTQAQKEAGNYKVGRVRIAGMDISIENPRGSVRSGVSPDGTAWENRLASHYGYLNGTKAIDGDQVDVFVGPNPDSTKVFVIDQVDEQGKFDEPKALMGFDSLEDARAGYLANYAPGWTGLGAITELPIDAFKSWAKDGTKRKPLGRLDAQQSVVASPAAVATGPVDGPSGDAGRSGGDVRPLPDADAGREGALPVAPASRSAAPAPVVDGDPAATPLSPPRVIARAGRTPTSATPLELRANADGSVSPWHEGNALVDYESGEPIVLPAGVSDGDAKGAIRAAGALSKRVSFFHARGDAGDSGNNDQDTQVRSATQAAGDQAVAAAPGYASDGAAAGPAAAGAAAAQAGGMKKPDSRRYDLTWNLSKGTRVGTADDIAKLYATVENRPPAQRDAVRFAVVDADQASRLRKDTGLDLDGFRRSVDNHALRHIAKSHGEAESRRGQSDITQEDVARIPDIVANYDKASVVGKDEKGNDLIRYTKRYNGTTFYVEEVRTGRRDLTAKTLWKMPTAPRAPLESGLAQTPETLGGRQPQRGEILQQPPKARARPNVRGSTVLGALSEQGGLSLDLLEELSQRTARSATSKKTGKVRHYTTFDNPPHAGKGPLFRRGGEGDLQIIAHALEEAGMIPAGLSERDPDEAKEMARQIIKAELNQGGSASRQGDAESMDAEYRALLEAAMDRFEDQGVTPEQLEALGLAEHPENEQDALDDYVLAMAGERESAAIDSFFDSLADVEAQEERDAIQAEIDDTRVDARAGQGGEITAGAAQGAPRRSAGNGPQADAVNPDEQGQASGLSLTAPTPEGLAANEQRAKDGAAADAKEQAKLTRQANQERERKELGSAAAQANSADGFELGQTPAQVQAAMAGQGDMLAEPPASAAPAKADSPPAPAPATKIADAGEKIGGSRADRWKTRGLDVADLDAMSEAEGAELATKANVWKPDWQALVDGGMPTPLAAHAKLVYDRLAAAPRNDTPDGRRRYVKAMQAVRLVYGDLTIENAASARDRLVYEQLGVQRNSGMGAQSDDARKTLFSVYKGRSEPFSLDRGDMRKIEQMLADGFPGKGEPWKRRFVLRSEGGPGTTPDGAAMYVAESTKLGTPLTEQQVLAGMVQVRTKVGKRVAYAPTMADAEAAAKTLYQSSLAKEAGTEPERPHLDSLKREGLAATIDRDVSADDFIERFAWRGVEFGNWSAQDERQRLLNLAFDGLNDLAMILNVPPKALSLNGTMGMAFGARGGGRFAAHYEPGKLVINMTKINGGGSLAHEWAHAFDHYLGELDTDNAYQAKARGATGWNSRNDYSGKPRKRMLRNAQGQWENSVEASLPNLRPELADTINGVMRALFGDNSYAATQYAKEARKLSGKSADGYWLRPTEMWARAFESYVFDRLVAMGAKSEYLVHGVEAERFAAADYKGNPYPVGEERAAINAAFDKVVAEIKTREGEDGNVVLFSRAAPGSTGTQSAPTRIAKIEALVETVRQTWANAPEVEVIADMSQAPEAARIEDESQKSQGANDEPAAFFMNGIAYLVAGQLKSDRQVIEALVHESFHAAIAQARAAERSGLVSFFGEPVGKLLDQLAALNPAAVQAKAIAYGLAKTDRDGKFSGYLDTDASGKVVPGKKEASRRRAAEEVLAELSQTRPSSTWVQRAIAAIRNWLRQNVPGLADMALSEAEIIERFIVPARRFIEQGKGFADTQPGVQRVEPSFQRAPATDSAAFKKWFGDSKVVDADGKPLVVYHGTKSDFQNFDLAKFGASDEGLAGKGFYFTYNPEEASGYALNGQFGNGGAAPNVRPAYVSLTKPLVITQGVLPDGRTLKDMHGGIGVTRQGGNAVRKLADEGGHDGVMWSSRDGAVRHVVAFRPEQIKSAIGNRGTFDPASPDIAFSRSIAGTLRPSTGMLDVTLRKFGGSLLARLTSGTYTRLIGVMDRGLSAVGGGVFETIKAGVVDNYGLSEPYLDAKQGMKTALRRSTRDIGDILDALQTLDRAQSRVAYLWMQEKPNAAEERRLTALLPEASREFLVQLKDKVDDLSREAVALGLLSPDTYERNAMAYLHRSYARYELDNQDAKVARSRSIKILGDQFKGRGMRDDATMARIGAPGWFARKTAGQKADVALAGQKFTRLERRELPDTDTPDMVGGQASKLGTLRELVYWPLGEPIPRQYADWRTDGVWEARFFDKSASVGMWRDFTLAERTAMGEIQDVRYSVAKTLMQGTRDVETARLLDWVAKTESKLAASQLPEGAEVVAASDRLTTAFKPSEWVQVPTANIPGTDVARYANLAGRFVPGPIWNDLRQIAGLTNQGDIARLYGKLLNAWKASKTALSPVTHMNNVMSNFVFADMHDLQARHIYGALKAWGTYKTNPEAKALIEAYQDNGGDAGKFNESELNRELFADLMEQLERDINGNSGSELVSAAQVVDLFKHREYRQMFAAMGQTKTARGMTWVPRKMMKLYGVEDEMFRLAAFIKARADGVSDKEAGKFARDSFLNYDINAPWINAARRSVFPFISFTYRAVPMLAQSFADKPWKLVKYAALAGVLNTLAYGMLGGDDGDEDEERALLPDEKSGKVWGLVPKLMRMPWNRTLTNKDGSTTEAPVFLDIRRWVPGGDIIDFGQQHTAVPVPPPLMPGGPLVLLGEVLANRSLFTNKDITLQTDTLAEKWRKVGGYLWRSVAPNAPIVPGSYSATAIMKAGGGETDAFGREYSLGQALSSSLGVKVASYPRDALVRNASFDAQAKIRELRGEIKSQARAAQRGGIDDEELQDEVAVRVDKIKKVREELQRKLSGQP